MSEGETQQVQTIRACTIARDIEAFDLLIEDMEDEYGETWGGLTFDNAIDNLLGELAKDIEIVAVAVNREDEDSLQPVAAAIRTAKERGISVILVPHDLNTVALHQLMRVGADDFAPYPLPEGALKDAIERIKTAKEQEARLAQPVAAPAPMDPTANRNGIVLPVYGLSGGTGSTTFATNLAWELQTLVEPLEKKVCILDLDFQYGAVSTYLDTPRTDLAFEFMSDVGAADSSSLRQAMTVYREKLAVLPSAQDALPLEFIGPEEVAHLIELARKNHDFVVIDVPLPLVSWSEAVLEAAKMYLAVIELDMRTAQNIMRFMRTLKAEDLPFEKVQFVLNRAPKFTDMAGKARVKRMRESLEIEIKFQLPDGGKAVANAGDEGEPLALNVPKNPLRKEIAKVAATIAELAEDEEPTIE